MGTRDLMRSNAPSEMTVELGTYQERVRAAVAETAAEEDVAGRIWAHNYTVWKPGRAEITNRLGWLRAPGQTLEALPRVQRIVSTAGDDGISEALLLGMGGSSLAGEMFGKVFGAQTAGPGPGLKVLDSTDPGAVLTYAEHLAPVRTLFLVATKSGTRVETQSFFRVLYDRTLGELDAEEAGRRFVGISDPGSLLLEAAVRYGFRDIFVNDPNGGMACSFS